MENIFGGLIVALATGLAFVAYRHPLEYKRFGAVVAGLGAVGIIAIVAYRLGVAEGRSSFLDADRRVQVGWRLYFMQFGFIGLIIYVFALEALAPILRLDGKQNEKDQEGDGEGP